MQQITSRGSTPLSFISSFPSTPGSSQGKRIRKTPPLRDIFANIVKACARERRALRKKTKDIENSEYKEDGAYEKTVHLTHIAARRELHHFE